MPQWVAVTKHIDNILNIASISLQQDPIKNPINNENKNNDEPVPVVPLPTPSPKGRNITWLENSFCCEGELITIMVPSTHKIEHRKDISRWKNDSEKLEHIRSKLKRKQYFTDSETAQALWAIALSAVPSLALSSAQFLFPLIIYAFFFDTALFEPIDMTLFAQSFPSDWLLRRYSYVQAARDTILLGSTLINQVIYMACDKGNKKGIGHFVKIVCWWDRQLKSVQTQVLDIDASGGTTLECAQAIRSSMNKLKIQDDVATHLLHGQGTDSGGGGVLEDLADKLQDLGNICVPPCSYLVANCTIHALQLQISNAIKITFGDGGLEKVNAMQLLHSVYRLQESLSDLNEWRHILYRAGVYVSTYKANDVVIAPPNATAQQKNEAAFRQQFNKVYCFHTAFKRGLLVDPSVLSVYKGTIYYKMTAPILTRWWTVGAAASYAFDYYLHLYVACQQVINIYDSTHVPNKIASTLFVLMSNQENFLDMMLIRSFHKAYVNYHLDWLQQSVDLSSKQGFQSHQMLVRFYVMSIDIRDTHTRRTFDQYRDAVGKFEPEDGIETQDETPIERVLRLRSKHLDKMKVFIGAARDSLFKHFDRWVSHKLLPSALLSELPIAQVVAAAMLHLPMPSFPTLYNRLSGRTDYKSKAHANRKIELRSFDKFLREQMSSLHDMDDDDDILHYSPQAIEAAHRVLAGIDLRSFDYEDQDNGELRCYMHTTYLALPSQTQFVERGVKDAKEVSSTDRSEQLQTCMAIVRLPSPLGKIKEDPGLSYNANKVVALVKSAEQRARPHTVWKREQVDKQYDQQFNAVMYSLSQGHFKQERIDFKKDNVDDKGSKCKKPNAVQQAGAVQQLMPAVTGLIPFGKLVKKRNLNDLKIELLYRNVPENQIPKSITERKNMLQDQECKRLIGEGVEQVVAMAQSKKHFKKQSAAPFKLVD